MDLYKLTGGELHRLMKEKKVSAVEVTEDTFARIAKVENGIGAFITATPEEAMKTAQAVDKDSSRRGAAPPGRYPHRN